MPDGGSIQVCQHCAAKIQDPAQATCPNCLEELTVRTFGSEDALAGFRRDRQAHGAPVPDANKGATRPGLALVFGFAALVLLFAGGGIAFSGLSSGSWPQATQSLTQAAVPLAIGLGLTVIAGRYGGFGR